MFFIQLGFIRLKINTLFPYILTCPLLLTFESPMLHVLPRPALFHGCMRCPAG
jgi:hypothetical protein